MTDLKEGPLVEPKEFTRDELLAYGQIVSKHCMQFKDNVTWRSVTQLTITFGLFWLSMLAMYWSLDYSYLLTLMLAVPASGLLVRLFMIQHDCGHGSYFASSKANIWVGRILSVFTVTPFDFWKKAHALHHATCGNLEKRGIGDIQTLTVDEFRNLPRLKQIQYRLYRNPIILFVVGMPVHFAILQRIPFWQPLPFKQVWRSILGLDLSLLIVGSLFIYWLGAAAFLMIYLPVMFLGAIIGGWLFFVQHQYEDTYWEDNADWSFQLAGLLGSSYYDLPKILQWFTGSIGLHHIHHLNSRIPNYRLQECLDASPELQSLPNRLSLVESLGSIPLALWDEDRKKLVSFGEAGF